jgi:hypothetical protein
MNTKINIVKYRLQTEMENLKIGSINWFKDYIKQVLESEKPYYEKADYIAYSINQLQNKIDYVSNEIKELQDLKKSLASSKELAMEITASVLAEYGIDKLEGANISSITITPEKSKTENLILIKDDQAVMRLGFVSFSPDYKAIEKTLTTNDGYVCAELSQYVEVSKITTTTQSKIKINNKRNASNNINQMDEILISEEEQYENRKLVA